MDPQNLGKALHGRSTGGEKNQVKKKREREGLFVFNQSVLVHGKKGMNLGDGVGTRIFMEGSRRSSKMPILKNQ